MQMARKMALVDYQKCRPENYDSGLCAAAQACPSKLLRQEAPYSQPMPEPSFCRACGDCIRACEQKAIRMASS